ncbi:MAG: PAS domain S-box protein, partial [Spirochaetaceae bacterium]
GRGDFSAAEHLPELVYEFDATGKILFVNQIIEEYGYSRQELLGRDVFQIVHPEDRERAIPLGMIATELVTNALRHAFLGDIRGRILVSLELSGNEATLRVADNGVGLTEPPDSEPPHSIGHELVVTLAEQVGAAFGSQRLEPETVFTLQFSLR